MEKSKRSNLLVRTVSGVLFTAVVVGASLLSHSAFVLLLAAVGAETLREFYRLAERSGSAPQRVAGCLAGTALLLLNLVPEPGRAVVATAVAAAAAILTAQLYRKSQSPLADTAVTLTGLAYVAAPLFMAGRLPLQGGGYDPWIFLWYIFIVWANDTMAYLVGITLGRHKMFPRISPKKSWEGLAGGIAAGIATACAAAWVRSEPLLFWAGLGAVVVAGGVFGDLVESMFKRSCVIKDSGTMMPGHGGLLDRFDAVLLSAPLAYAYFTIFAN